MRAVREYRDGEHRDGNYSAGRKVHLAIGKLYCKKGKAVSIVSLIYSNF